MVVVVVSVVGYAVLGTIEPDDDPTADIGVTVTDETVTVVHRGGDPLAGDDLTVVLRADGTETRYDFATDGTYGADAAFDPGERWRLDGSVPYDTGDRIKVIVVHEPSNAVLFRGRRLGVAPTGTATLGPPAVVTTPQTT
jgi:hypothetical protein